jgi:hypothetical protein
VNGGTWNTDMVVQKLEDVVSCLATSSTFCFMLGEGLAEVDIIVRRGVACAFPEDVALGRATALCDGTGVVGARAWAVWCRVTLREAAWALRIVSLWKDRLRRKTRTVHESRLIQAPKAGAVAILTLVLIFVATDRNIGAAEAKGGAPPPIWMYSGHA